MDVVWSSRATEANHTIYRYLSQYDERIASRVVDRIRETGDRLGVVVTGRPGRIPGPREKPVSGQPYILLYVRQTRSGREYILILDVVHMSRNWPRGRLPPL